MTLGELIAELTKQEEPYSSLLDVCIDRPVVVAMGGATREVTDVSVPLGGGPIELKVD